MAVSSNTLFHFAKKLEFLKQAINEGLWPRYCVEKKWNGKDFAIPMLCFCDIPLSQIKNHIDENNGYGCYGIGVTKHFARVHKITPVTYLYEGALLKNKIDYFIRTFDNPSSNVKKMNVKEFMLYYVKKVNGYNNENDVARKFYNEREWRYIPAIGKDVHIEILQADYDEQTIKNEYSKMTKKLKIILKPEDIAYIIVKNESDIKQIIDVLRKKYNGHRQLEKLYSRIITVQQIQEDF